MGKTGMTEEGMPWPTKASLPPFLILSGDREAESPGGMIHLTLDHLFHPAPSRI